MRADHQYVIRDLSRRLRDVDVVERLKLTQEVLTELGKVFFPNICALLLDELGNIDARTLEALAEGLPDTPNGAYLRTQLPLSNRDLLEAWERFQALEGVRNPFDLLSWASALVGGGKFEDSAAKLRLALSGPLPATFFSRSQKLVRDLQGKIQSYSRRSKIAVLGSSTTTFLMPILQALCLRDRIQAEFYEGPFGLIEQEVLESSSGLARFRPDLVLLLTHWRDLGLEAVTVDEPAWIESFIAGRKALWKHMADSFSCHIIQPSFDYPAVEAYGHLAAVLPGGRTRLIDLLNLRLREEAPAYVSILDMAAVQRRVGTRNWEDEVAWTRYRQHPSTEALPEIAEEYSSHIRALSGLSRKVLVTDLDNTLWSGVIGEDGIDGIGIGPGTPEGETYQHLQQYMLDLKRRGVLLAVCSKNNPDDARLPFQKHPEMSLRLEDFAAFRANWEDKVTNLRAIAQELSLSLDSFVFLDDNPFERDWVRSQLPEVAVVELGPSPFQYARQLDRGDYFKALRLSAEDLTRADQYRVQALRENLRASSASIDDFLRELRLDASVEEVSVKNLPRVTQLVNKTNQFNLTTRRYTESQLRALAEDRRTWIRAFQMSDRMGSYGLIGVLCCIPGHGEDEWDIDTWLMSCRTLGRQMEKFMFDRLIEAAVSCRIRRIIGVYRPTKKNELAKQLYEQLGFHRLSETEAEARYEIFPCAGLPLTATHVRNTTPSSELAGQ